MPRGSTAKQARAHKRATESGRSTRGSCHMATSQKKGKRYKKKEICHSGSQTNILHDGNIYVIYYKTEVLEEWFKRLFCIEHTHGLIVEGIFNQKYIGRIGGCVDNAKNYMIKEEQLMEELISKFHKKMGGRFVSKLK